LKDYWPKSVDTDHAHREYTRFIAFFLGFRWFIAAAPFDRTNFIQAFDASARVILHPIRECFTDVTRAKNPAK
jgi:hypothetical protein